MAARYKPKKYTLASTDPVSLKTVLASVNDDYVGSITARAGGANAGTVYWCDAAGEEGGFLEAREAATIDLTGKYIFTGDLYFKGSAGDVIYLTVIG